MGHLDGLRIKLGLKTKAALLLDKLLLGAKTARNHLNVPRPSSFHRPTVAVDHPIVYMPSLAVFVEHWESQIYNLRG